LLPVEPRIEEPELFLGLAGQERASGSIMATGLPHCSASDVMFLLRRRDRDERVAA
jgi:hypothetical protein